MFNFDSLQTLLRAVLKVGGGYLLAKGMADESSIETVTAGVIALAGVIWGVMHRTGAKPTKEDAVKVSGVLLALVLACGCASANSVAFRTEKLATDTAYASVVAWKAYYRIALTNTLAERLPDLTNQNASVYAASRSFAAVMSVADGIRESCATNAAASNKTALTIALEAARGQSSNVVWLVRGFMAESKK
jgi:hypothetical protein